jgi:hypothetical protein
LNCLTGDVHLAQKIEELDLPAWVKAAPSDKKNFREAVHIVLNAISTSAALRSKMVMKGGMLMAIRYGSSRFTKNTDFSTVDMYKSGDEKAILAELDKQLDAILAFAGLLARLLVARAERDRRIGAQAQLGRPPHVLAAISPDLASRTHAKVEPFTIRQKIFGFARLRRLDQQVVELSHGVPPEKLQLKSSLGYTLG